MVKRHGRLELDVPVSRYLTRWQLPPSESNNDGLTVRRLLSHTAGLTDGGIDPVALSDIVIMSSGSRG
jgi:CubicO group peptidase (beta-lactamase class C family)